MKKVEVQTASEKNANMKTLASLILSILAFLLALAALIYTATHKPKAGPPGIQGPPGPVGSTGPTGPTGLSGRDGRAAPPAYPYPIIDDTTSTATVLSEINGTLDDIDDVQTRCNENVKCRGFTYDDSIKKYTLRGNVNDDTRISCGTTKLFVKDDPINRLKNIPQKSNKPLVPNMPTPNMNHINQINTPLSQSQGQLQQPQQQPQQVQNGVIRNMNPNMNLNQGFNPMIPGNRIQQIPQQFQQFQNQNNGFPPYLQNQQNQMWGYNGAMWGNRSIY